MTVIDELPLIGLHPQRGEVLAALALVARSRQPLPEGFARLAAPDPLLAPWVARLSGPLSSGAPLGGVLRKLRLIDREQAKRLDRSPDQMQELDATANAMLEPLHGLWLVQWFPVAVAAALVAPALVFAPLVTTRFRAIYLDLGIPLPWVTSLVVSTGNHPEILIGAVLFLAFLFWCLRRIDPLSHLTQLWWPEIHRTAALLTLFEAARRDQQSGWKSAWCAWWVLTRWRAPSPAWARAKQQSTVRGKLREMFPVDEQRPEAWSEWSRSVREHLVSSLNVAASQARALLVIAIGASVMFLALALFMPLLRVIDKMGQS